MLRTEKQRKELCASCPVAKVADLIGDTCSLLILRDLMGEPRRFGHLDESLGVSTRTLTKSLRRLEKQGFIARKKYRRLPPKVLYRLTPKGKALGPLLDEMRAYGKRYL
jgi:DNA-binding HxlR family transcriptional regulator